MVASLGLTLRLAARGLGRRRGRTALTVGMLAFSTWMLVFGSGLNEGSYAEMIRMATETFTGQAQLQHPDYEASPSLFETVADGDAAAAWLRSLPGVAGAAPRIETGALLSHGHRTAGALVIGVDAAAERATSTLPGMVRQGAWLDAAPPAATAATAAPGAAAASDAPTPTADGASGSAATPRPPVLLGAGLARRLRAGVGAEVTLVTQAADGSMAAELLTVQGIVGSGLSELDASVALVRRADAAALLELGPRVHRVAVRLHDVPAADAFVGAATGAPPGALLRHWRDLLPSLEPSIQTDRAGMVVFLVVLLVVAALGVANAMLMTVMERRREIGVLLALGTTPGRIVATICWESTLQALLGAGVGTALGLLCIWYFHDVGIRFTDQPIEFGGATFDVVHPIVTWRSWAYPSIVAAIGALAGVWPAWRAARQLPAQAMRADAQG